MFVKNDVAEPLNDYTDTGDRMQIMYKEKKQIIKNQELMPKPLFTDASYF